MISVHFPLLDFSVNGSNSRLFQTSRQVWIRIWTYEQAPTWMLYRPLVTVAVFSGSAQALFSGGSFRRRALATFVGFAGGLASAGVDFFSSAFSSAAF